MQLVLDLHTHSGYAGGAGEKDLVQTAWGAQLKGIHILGTGDCLHNKWLNRLKKHLEPAEEGLLKLNPRIVSPVRGYDPDAVRFLLQTELIFTAPQILNSRKKQVWHAIFLFPSYREIELVQKIFASWGVLNTIGRPFVKCENIPELQEKIEAILDTNPLTEMILAHILTNNGFFGYKSQNNHFEETLGKKLNRRIKLIETGLSADPKLLKLIPELRDKVWVSFSDSHSGKLYRIGRELTVLKDPNPATAGSGSSNPRFGSFRKIIKALRNNQISETIEFKPEEGRYFLTGHRAGKVGHKDGTSCVFEPSETPLNRRCPVCGRPLTIGVYERALELNQIQKEQETAIPATSDRPHRHLVPLINLIPGKNMEIYENLVKPFGGEYSFWKATEEEIIKRVGLPSEAPASGGAGLVKEEEYVKKPTLEKILKIRAGKFSFEPGYDGVYGKLKIP
jgi:PHP family Zn ribbon phosphoesterase